jgi:hypothetical protein
MLMMRKIGEGGQKAGAECPIVMKAENSKF